MEIRIVSQLELKQQYTFFLAWRQQSVLRVSPSSCLLGQVHTPKLATHLDKLSDKQVCWIMPRVGCVEIVANWLPA